MEYRSIGNTGMSASVIGLGAEHLDNKPYEVVEETVHAALELDVNIMDLFMPGEKVRSNIGKALKGNRDKFLIQGHIGSVDLNEKYDINRDPAICKTYFENLLRDLNTDYIDFGMLFFMDSDKAYQAVFESEILTYVQNLKKKGIIRAIGASSHNPTVARRVVESGVVDLLMFSINPAFDMTPAKTDVLSTLDDTFSSQTYLGIDRERSDLYRLCEQKNVAITVMKTFGAGKLLTDEHSPFDQKMSVGQCIHYALTRPAVVSALVGCESRAQMQQAVDYLTLTPEERDYTSIISNYKGGFAKSCVYCSHCQPCPAGIDIAAVNKYLDIALLDKENISPSILAHYKSLESNGSDCIACGNCEERCPFSVPIIENMRLADSILRG